MTTALLKKIPVLAFIVFTALYTVAQAIVLAKLANCANSANNALQNCMNAAAALQTKITEADDLYNAKIAGITCICGG